MQRYEIVRKIGKGSFGTVDLIKRRTDRKSFVLKRMKIGSVSKKERDMCHNEVQLLERLNHPSIVRYEESFVDKQYSESYLCVVMAYCDGGDLTHFLKNQRGKKLKEKQILDLFVQIALALHFIHDRNILHRDLKTQNIFVKNGQLKLGDFGISKVLTGSVAFAQTMIGTPYYMSPEVFKGKPYNFKSDIWSLGCVLYELITFKHCFDANNLNSLASKIVKGKYIPITNNKYRNELKTLCYSMLHQIPSSRPTLNQILKHKLLQNRIRDFYISCYKKFKKNIISNSTFNNLKNQLWKIGLQNILENIENITKEQNLKKEQKRKLIMEQKSIEKEKKIQKDMENALEKLKIERKWRNAKKKQRQKIMNKYDRNNYNNFGIRSNKMRGFAEQQTINDKRRQAAKQRKLQILKQQEQKRQQLAAKHRNKQLRAAERKYMELNRKIPNYKSPQRIKSKLKYHESPIQKNEKQQVEQLNVWENAHIIKSKKIKYKFENNKEPAHKSALSLLQQKIKYQKENDSLEILKKRRELIQKRLNEISERHKQRQIKKQSMYNKNNDIYKYNCSKKDVAVKSEKNIEEKKKAKSLQSTPYRKPKSPNVAKNIPFMSPKKPKAKSVNGSPFKPSPLKFGGINILSTEASSKQSSISVSPMPEIELDMNPRQKMEARKRAKADLRAKQIKQANFNEYKTNQIKAQENKYKNTKMLLSRAASVEIFDEIINDKSNINNDNECVADMLSDCAISEPPINEFSHVIMTIEESNELNEIEEDEIEEDIVEEEIDELKQTLAQHTKQIEEIKNEILQQRKNDLSDSDNCDDDDIDSVDDIETLLNVQEQTMKTMRLNQENNDENVSIQNVIPNNNNVNEEEDIINEIDNELDNESDESEEMPIGRLVDRVEFIKKKCVIGMGLDGFKIAYNFMKQLQFEENDDCMILIDNKIKELCINSNVSKSRIGKYRSLIDQLLFIEANCS